MPNEPSSLEQAMIPQQALITDAHSSQHVAAQVIQPRFAGLHGDPARLVVDFAASRGSMPSGQGGKMLNLIT